MLKIDQSKRSLKFLNKLPLKHSKQLAKKIMQLREVPFPSDSKKLIGTQYNRVDCGEYRIIYFVEKQTLFVVLIGKRNDNAVYKELQKIPELV